MVHVTSTSALDIANARTLKTAVEEGDWKRDHVSLCLQCKASETVRVATYDTLRCDFTGFEVKRRRSK